MPGTAWTTEDKARLEQLVRSGQGPVTIQRQGIFQANGHGPRSLHAIAQQIRRMHLAPPESSERARLARLRGRSIPAEQRRRAEEYLRTQGSAVPVHHVVQRFGVTESWVRRTLKRMGISRSWTATVAHPLSKFHDPEYRTAVSRRVKAQAATRAEQRRQRLQVQCARIREAAPSTPMRRCEHCDTQWPLNGEFFPSYPRPQSGRTYYLHLCRLCAAVRRRSPREEESGEGLRSRRLRTQLLRRREEARREATSPGERSCRACWEDWPLTIEFWRASRGKSGQLIFEPRCRLCENSRRRASARARNARRVFARNFVAPAIPQPAAALA